MPPKAKRAKSPESRFLFVNEDASTVNRTTKDAELDRTKQSHVQRQNFARKRRLRDESNSAAQRSSSQSSISPSPALAGPSTELSSPPGGLSHGADYVDILQSLDLGESNLTPTSPQTQSGILDPRLFSEPFVSQAPSTRISPAQEAAFGSAHSYRPGHFFDTPSPSYDATSPSRRPISSGGSTSLSLSRISPPATNIQRQLEQWGPPLIRYYNTVILPEQFWMDTRKVPMGQIRHALSIHADMQACMSEPSHMYAFLASAATQMIEREGRLLIPDASVEDIQRVPTFFKTKAIQALRAKLGSGLLDQHTAVDVHRLYATTIYSDNYESAEPHFQALLSMVETLGGLSTFDDYQLESLIRLDCYAALKRMEVPRLVATWDPGQLPEDELQMMESHGWRHTQATSGFDDVWQAWQLCDVQYETYSDIAQVLNVATYLFNSPQYNPEQQKWLSWRTYALMHRLLSLPLNYELDEMSESFRVATIYWIVTSSSPVQGRRWVSTSNNLLKSHLEKTDLQYLWSPHTNSLLWIAVFGGICTADQEELGFYVNLARNAALQIGVSNLQQMEELFSTFLYDANVQREMLAEFAERMWPDSNQ